MGHGPPPLWLRYQFNFPIYLIFASLAHSSFYFRRAQQRDRRALELEKHLAQARLQSLHAQLHPHFYLTPSTPSPPWFTPLLTWRMT